MTQPIGKSSLSDSKKTMSLASKRPALGASPGESITDSGMSSKKLSDFSSRKLGVEKVDAPGSAYSRTAKFSWRSNVTSVLNAPL